MDLNNIDFEKIIKEIKSLNNNKSLYYNISNILKTKNDAEIFNILKIISELDSDIKIEFKSDIRNWIHVQPIMDDPLTDTTPWVRYSIKSCFVNLF